MINTNIPTYDLLIHHVCQLDTHCFSTLQRETTTINKNTKEIKEIHKCYFRQWLKKQTNKFTFVFQKSKEFYYANHASDKHDFMELFYTIQKFNMILNKCVHHYKTKRRKFVVTTDLQLNELNPESVNVICIHHENSNYLFTIGDLLTIIYNSLTYHFSFFSEPTTIKNPYNNLPFGKSVLYYIYYYLTCGQYPWTLNSIHFDHLSLFYKFKECGFNLSSLSYKYEYLLREYILLNYVNNSPLQTLVNQIKILIGYYNHFRSEHKQIVINKDFPPQTLVKIMRPYLYLKLVENYSLVQLNQYNARQQLAKKMDIFQKYNPQFGRKKVVLKTVLKNGKYKRYISHVEFDTRHVPFTMYQLTNFMNNHLPYHTHDIFVAPPREARNTITHIISDFIESTINAVDDEEEDDYDDEEEEEDDYEEEEDDYEEDDETEEEDEI